MGGALGQGVATVATIAGAVRGAGVKPRLCCAGHHLVWCGVMWCNVV